MKQIKNKKFPRLKGKAILSPMSGVTDVAFRALCKKYGAALTCTEFLNSTAINRKNKNEVGKFKLAFNKEIFYQNLEQPAASDDKGHNRILIIINEAVEKNKGVKYHNNSFIFVLKLRLSCSSSLKFLMIVDALP